MLLMTADYARARNDKAERTRNWLVGHMRVKPFITPRITAIDVAQANEEARAASPRRRSRAVEREAEPA